VLIIAVVTLMLVAVIVIDSNALLRIYVRGEQDINQIRLIYDYKQRIENLYRNVSVKSFGCNVYLFELVPLRV